MPVFVCLNKSVVPLLKTKDIPIQNTFSSDETSLKSISPIDGRYSKQLQELNKYFSEYGYMKYRVKVEVEYVIFLSKNAVAPPLNEQHIKALTSLYTQFSTQDAREIKQYESVTNHDIKAVEYYVQKKCTELHLTKLIPSIHWGITSDDTNNLALGMALNECNKLYILPTLCTLLELLKHIARREKKSLLLARTHGQPAVPTTFGKELTNFYTRLGAQYTLLKTYSFEGKLMGAVGTLSAHKRAFPTINWVEKSKQFVSSLGLKPNIYVTQILPYDNWISYFHILSTINSILIGMSQDLWMYIMLEEVKLKKKEGEVGSSTMPQKVNPIDFENAEGNISIANAYFQLYERKLLISRLQRDLSDSTVKRTFGTALAHTVLAWKSITKGLQKIEFDANTAFQHAQEHYEILGEALQTELRLQHDEAGYEKVKKMMRGKKVDKKLYQAIVKELGLKEIENLTPEKYIGYAEELVTSGQ